MKDPYATLGVSRSADEDAIRRSYRKLARKYHPDVNPGDSAAEERFKEISEAYAVLSDSEKKALYDEFGEPALSGNFDAEAARRARDAFRGFGGGGVGGGPPGGDFAGGGLGGLEDLFSGIFGGGARAPRSRRGSDLEAEIELDFLEAARGGEQRLTINRPGPDGRFQQESVTVRIPAGVDDGGRIRIPGKGAAGLGGAPAGDLYAKVRVRPHRFFRREGRDIYLDLPITVREAVLGAKVEAPTLEGRVTVTIPPGTDSGTKLRLRGKGVQRGSKGPRGDLYVVVQIRVPRGIDPQTAQQLAELTELDLPDVRKELLT